MKKAKRKTTSKTKKATKAPAKSSKRAKPAKLKSSTSRPAKAKATKAKAPIKKRTARPLRKAPAKVKAKSRKPTRKPVVAKAIAPPKPKWPPLVETLLLRLDEAKAEQIVAIDLAGKSTMADTMVVASGRSNRHVDAIARQAIEELEKHGVKNIRSEGMPQCDWVLVDAGDILLHVFRPEVRSFYNLEKLWSAHAP